MSLIMAYGFRRSYGFRRPSYGYPRRSSYGGSYGKWGRPAVTVSGLLAMANRGRRVVGRR